VGVTEGREVEPGAGEEAVDEAWPLLHPFEPGLHQCGELAEVVFGEVGQGPLEVRPAPLRGLEPLASCMPCLTSPSDMV